MSGAAAIEGNAAALSEVQRAERAIRELELRLTAEGLEHDTEKKLFDYFVVVMERVGAFAIGVGIVTAWQAFVISTNASELGAMLGGSAAPFTFAGFMYIASTMYAQQKQVLIAEQQRLATVLGNEMSKFAAIEREHDRLFQLMIEQLDDTTDALTISRKNSGVGSVELARGAQCFSLLFRISGRFSGSTSVDGAKGEGDPDRAVDSWQEFWVDYKEVVYGYLRQIDRVAKVIAESSRRYRDVYSSVLMSRLSERELWLIRQALKSGPFELPNVRRVDEIVKGD